jgi:hypothetical protein
MSRVRRVRLHCNLLCVDARLRNFDGRWIASVDAPDGPTLGIGFTAEKALRCALQPFDDLIDDLLASLPTAGRRGPR